MLRILRCCITTLIVAAGLLPASAYADDVLNGTIYYYDEVVDTGTDTGYSESNTIKESNPHFGWKLGTFSITRFTSVAESNKGYPVFLKTVGDKVKLSFNLDQDINALNGSETLSINDDDNGYDQHFGVAKQDFGRGTLIVRQTNYQNETSAPQVYVNYLDGVEQGAETEVELFEEGDYEVSLNYEIKDDPRKVGPVSIAPEYSNYKIIFKFAVRNGNCMLFPFDLATGNELANESYAPEGFYLDLARSRYLDINVKKEVMAPGTNGLVEDTRFNGPARDGDRYTEDGIYTLTAKNDYTGQETVKKIYVGDDPVLKCYAVTGTPIKEISQRVSDGEVIAENGQLVTPEAAEEIAEDVESHHGIGVLLGVAIALAIIFGIATPIGLRKRRAAQQRELPESGAAQILPSPPRRGGRTMRMGRRLIAVTLCTCLALSGCTAPTKAEETSLASPASYEYPSEYDTPSDPDLVDGLEESVYDALVSELESGDYLVDEVEVAYVSQEYLDEVAFNSQSNVFFGYSLEDVVRHFGDTPYVFTNDGNTTVAKEFTSYDDTWEKVASNVAVGAGVIVVCATVTAIAPAVGAPTAITAIFTFATEGAVIGSVIDASVSGTVAGIMKGLETGDAQEAIKAAALGASEGFKTGAIIGAATGGITEGAGLLRASRSGLSMSEAATIQMESELPLQVIRDMRNMDEYAVYKNAGLTPCTIKTPQGNRTVLAREIDLKRADKSGLTNLERMNKGLNPLDANGNPYEYHHVGQKNNGALALLTREEHDSKGLHMNQVSEIQREAFGSEKKLINSTLAKAYSNQLAKTT